MGRTFWRQEARHCGEVERTMSEIGMVAFNVLLCPLVSTLLLPVLLASFPFEAGKRLRDRYGDTVKFLSGGVVAFAIFAVFVRFEVYLIANFEGGETVAMMILLPIGMGLLSLMLIHGLFWVLPISLLFFVVSCFEKPQNILYGGMVVLAIGLLNAVGYGMPLLLGIDFSRDGEGFRKRAFLEKLSNAEHEHQELNEQFQNLQSLSDKATVQEFNNQVMQLSERYAKLVDSYAEAHIPYMFAKPEKERIDAGLKHNQELALKARDALCVILQQMNESV